VASETSLRIWCMQLATVCIAIELFMPCVGKYSLLHTICYLTHVSSSSNTERMAEYFSLFEYAGS